MDRPTRNRMVRWMNDHHIHYANAQGTRRGLCHGPRAPEPATWGLPLPSWKRSPTTTIRRTMDGPGPVWGDQHRAGRPLAPHGCRPALRGRPALRARETVMHFMEGRGGDPCECRTGGTEHGEATYASRARDLHRFV